MDGKKIQILLRCLEAGSMMKAAEALGYTPSGLTHMMDAVEHELGCRVIDRGRFGVKLTPQGQKLLPYLNELAEADRRLCGEAHRLAASSVQVLKIGAFASIARNWLPGMIADFQRECPGVEVEMTVEGREELFSQLLRGQHDMIFVSTMKKYNHEFIPLRKDWFYAVLPPDSDFDGDSFPVRQFDGYPFIMPSLGRDTDVQEVLDKYGASPKILASTADDPVVLSMVAGGLGVSLLSELVLTGDSSNVKALPLKPPACRRLGIAVRSISDMSPVEKRFAECVKAALK